MMHSADFLMAVFAADTHSRNEGHGVGVQSREACLLVASTLIPVPACLPAVESVAVATRG